VLTTRAEASEGHLNVLRWLRTQEPACPWERSTFEAAVEEGRVEVVQWLAEQQDQQGWTKQECEVALALMQR
jgi:hypothetical protein